MKKEAMLYKRLPDNESRCQPLDVPDWQNLLENRSCSGCGADVPDSWVP